MKKFVATSDAEVIGSAMHNFFVSLNQEMFSSIVKDTLAEHGIVQIQNEHWYPLQISLDVFKRIDEAGLNASENLVALGLAYVETATFPSEINTVSTALSTLPLTYHLNIRNVPQDEGYEILDVSPTHIQVVDHNPFPHDVVYGFIWGIARRFGQATGMRATVHRTFINKENPNQDGAFYDVQLESISDAQTETVTRG